ncbi:MAG: DUF1846 domain-containing protein [Clostridia bacterium]|nr:DUF1846 domain-containing protein [Clostridia bacterium]
MLKLGFDNEKYIALQSQKIKERIKYFGGKLYLEFGGKLFDDFHASRVLPGFSPDSKVKMLLKLKDQAEIVIVINSSAIESNKKRGDLGIGYDQDVLRLIDAFRTIGLYVGSVVITCFSEHSSVLLFEKRLKNLGIKVYRHYTIENYPSDIPHIVSKEGFGKNDYVKTSRSLVVVTAPGPGSGKMAVCLSQMFHDHLKGIKSGYAKFETFPIWNLPLKHSVNLAYEAATADLSDVNMIDPFHLEAYGETTVNYNRDIEIFPVLNSMMQKILGESPYKSPTDMGVNMAGYAIFDDDVVCQAANQEIVRRYCKTKVLAKLGVAEQNEVLNQELIMQKAGVSLSDRKVIDAALKKSEKTGGPAVAIELNTGEIITGKTSSLLGACASALLNALKTLAEIDDSVNLISPAVIEPVQKLKIGYMGNHNPRLHTDEILIALSICAATDSIAAKALEQLPKLAGCELHSTVILAASDEHVLRKLGFNVTSEPIHETKKLYHPR